MDSSGIGCVEGVATDFIPVNTPCLDGNERVYLAECIDSGWISSEGPFVRRFEQAMAARVGRRFGVAVSSGTAALHLAVEALGLGAGDEVILPTFTIISCASAVTATGARPVLVDSDPQTWNMDVGAIESRITERTRAILAVHTYGLPVDMGPVMALAERYGLAVIEDAAEAHGQCWRDRPCGGFGDVSVFSFYPNKLVTTGEGGMVLTDDVELAERVRALRNLCFEGPRRFVHERLGYNYRMTNLQAAVGLAQLERLDAFVERKRQMGRCYDALLADVGGIQRPVVATDYAENVYWVYGVVLEDGVGFEAAEAMRRLREMGIGTRPFFWPMHEQPVLRRMGLFEGASFPVAERLARRGFYIPSGLGLEQGQMERVAQAVRRVLG